MIQKKVSRYNQNADGQKHFAKMLFLDTFIKKNDAQGESNFDFQYKKSLSDTFEAFIAAAFIGKLLYLQLSYILFYLQELLHVTPILRRTFAMP